MKKLRFNNLLKVSENTVFFGTGTQDHLDQSLSYKLRFCTWNSTVVALSEQVKGKISLRSNHSTNVLDLFSGLMKLLHETRTVHYVSERWACQFLISAIARTHILPPFYPVLLSSPVTPLQTFLEQGGHHLEEPVVESMILTQNLEWEAQKFQAKTEGITAANEDGSGGFCNSEVYKGDGEDAFSEYSF